MGQIDIEEQEEKTGVKRVNNIPIIIIFTIVLVFSSIVAYFAYKKGEQSQVKREEIKENKSKQSSNSFAQNVMNGYRPKLEIPHDKVEPIKPVNEVKPTQPKVDQDAERIKQAKIQSFSQAVSAKTEIGSMSVSQNHNNKNDEIGKMVAAKIAEQQEARKKWHLDKQIEPPSSPFIIRAGTVIPGVMISGINSDLPGKLIGQVSQDVYDTATGKQKIIPQGSKLFGEYSSDIVFGQRAVMVAWNRITFPDGKTLDLGEMPGANLEGYSGYSDQVDNHLWRTFGSALLMSAILGGASLTQNQGASTGLGFRQDSTTTMSQILGQQMSQASMMVLRKNLNVQPTLEIRPGYEFNVITVKDVEVPSEYEGFDYSFN